MPFPPKPRWKEHYTKEEFKELLADTANWPMLQKKIGYSIGAVRYWGRQFNLRYPRGRRAEALAQVSDEVLRKMYDASLSVAEMARRVGCDVQSIQHRFEEMGQPIPHDLWARHYSEEEVVRLLSVYPVGWDEIMAKTGVNKRTLYRWAKQLGVPNPIRHNEEWARGVSA